jgi:hypothetical protein
VPFGMGNGSRPPGRRPPRRQVIGVHSGIGNVAWQHVKSTDRAEKRESVAKARMSGFQAAGAMLTSRVTVSAAAS